MLCVRLTQGMLLTLYTEDREPCFSVGYAVTLTLLLDHPSPKQTKPLQQLHQRGAVLWVQTCHGLAHSRQLLLEEEGL
jgi:hypothetical protein